MTERDATRAKELGLISPDMGPDGVDQDDDDAEALIFCEEEGLVWTEEDGWITPEDAAAEGLI